MASREYTLEIRIAWWWAPYCFALCFFCQIYRREPDYGRLRRVMQRAITIRPPRRPGRPARVLRLLPHDDPWVPAPIAWAIILGSLFITAQHVWAFWKG